ncbi:MAG: thermonuclease family protein [Gammaproteobacteria bacterium]|nr:thermonuclease family protein [Gammaproteobacteria bacterium]
MKATAILFALFLAPLSALADVSGTGLAKDGEVISVDGTPLRLHGIDVLEKDQLCRKSGVRCVGNETDKDGLLNAECFVDGYNLNARLVSEGWALAYTRYSDKYLPEQNQAKSEKKGMWVGEFVKPWDWRRGERLPSDY